MFEKKLGIGIGLGLTFLSPAVLLVFVLSKSISSNSDKTAIFISAFFLAYVMINGIGLILKKKWSLISSNILLIISGILLIYDFYQAAIEYNEVSSSTWRLVSFIVILFSGLALILNSDIVKKEFGKEVIHNDLDEILDA